MVKSEYDNDFLRKRLLILIDWSHSARENDHSDQKES